MQPLRRAVIDVGTNSVKLLVADVAGQQVQPVCEQSKQTRLGHGFYETHRLQPGAIAATAKAVADFAALARQAQAISIRVIATSAAREAVNREELTAAIEQAAGLKSKSSRGSRRRTGVSGSDHRPATSASALAAHGCRRWQRPDHVGRGRTHFRHSFPLGSVRLLETFPCSDPPKPAELAACRQWLKQFFQTEVRPRAGPAGSSFVAGDLSRPTTSRLTG